MVPGPRRFRRDQSVKDPLRVETRRRPIAHTSPADERFCDPQHRCFRFDDRLTSAFSKKVENHAAAVALYFMCYNFGRVHQTLRVTPAMEAGISDHGWSIAEIVGQLES